MSKPIILNLEEILNDPNRNLPATRELLLQAAWTQKQKGDDIKSILYQTLSLCHGFEEKYKYKDDELRLENIKFIKPPELPPDTESLCRKLCHQIRQLPEQWTVVQLCKAAHHINPIGRSKEILQTNAPIYLSLLAYPRWELNNCEPILVEIDMCETNLLHRFVEFDDMLAKKLSVVNTEDLDQRNKSYWLNIQELDSELLTLMTTLTKWLGPYSYLLTGKLKGPDGRAQTAELYRKVDTLSKMCRLTSRQQILLSMLATTLMCQTMGPEQIYEMCAKIATSQEQLDEMFELMASLDADQELNAYPCMLIVDERLDMVPWEMVNQFQDTCRLSSLQVLYELYDTNRANVADGYYQVEPQRGGLLLNPDGTLKQMEKRLLKYFEYYFPDWTSVAGKQPTKEEYQELLTQSDLYIYAGHGNGLQFLDGLQMSKLKIKAVSFLIGCASTKLLSNGYNSEMRGSHLDFHGAGCLTVVGSLWLITDFYADKMLTAILSNWLGANGAANEWNTVDLKKWKTGELVFSEPIATGTNCTPLKRSLDEVLKMARSLNTLPLRIRATLVVRGLPVMIRS